jgi:hypothetical protein
MKLKLSSSVKLDRAQFNPATALQPSYRAVPYGPASQARVGPTDAKLRTVIMVPQVRELVDLDLSRFRSGHMLIEAAFRS